MGANPMQKMKRNSILIGLIIGLVIGLILCAIVYFILLKTDLTARNRKRGKSASLHIK